MNSPFKFLDAYDKSDASRFFGRDRETAQLHNAVFASNLTLLYGASGTGKTSLINCGLANKFYDTDWLPLFIRRGANLNDSLDFALKNALSTAIQNDILSLADRVQLLYRKNYRPVFLIFDQFEELFILGKPAEAAAFYSAVEELLSAPMPPKIIFSIREEWIAYLNEFEKTIPYLFENRLRVEKMDDRNLFKVVGGTLRAAKIDIVDPSVTIRKILDNIRDRRDGVDLTNLQVYLDRVFRKANDRATPTDGVKFDPSVVDAVGAMQNVISAFLDEQFTAVETELTRRGVRQPKGLPLEILFTMISDDGTKKPVDLAAILDGLPRNVAMSEADVNYCLDEFKRIRILRETE